MKTEIVKYRASKEHKAAIKRAAKAAKVSISTFIQICLSSECSLTSDEALLRRTISRRNAT